MPSHVLTLEILPPLDTRIPLAPVDFGFVVPYPWLSWDSVRTWEGRTWDDLADEWSLDSSSCTLWPRWTPLCCADNDHKDGPRRETLWNKTVQTGCMAPPPRDQSSPKIWANHRAEPFSTTLKHHTEERGKGGRGGIGCQGEATADFIVVRSVK